MTPILFRASSLPKRGCRKIRLPGPPTVRLYRSGRSGLESTNYSRDRFPREVANFTAEIWVTGLGSAAGLLLIAGASWKFQQSSIRRESDHLLGLQAVS